MGKTEKSEYGRHQKASSGKKRTKIADSYAEKEQQIREEDAAGLQMDESAVSPVSLFACLYFELFDRSHLPALSDGSLGIYDRYTESIFV